MVIEIAAGSVTGTSPTGESRTHDAWAEAASFFDPLAGTAELSATRPDSDGATIDRYLLVNGLYVPQYRVLTARPKGLDESGAYDLDGSPYVVYVAEGDTAFPFWCDSTLHNTDTSDDPAELDVGAAQDTITVANDGDRWAGFRLVVKAASVSGTVTGFTVTNNTNGTSVAVTKATAMAAAEYLDWFATDPRVTDKTAAWVGSGAGNGLRLDKGNNELEVNRDSGTGTLTLQVSWPGLHYTV